MPATRAYKRYFVSQTLNTTQADMVQVPAGKTWLVLRAWDRFENAGAQTVRLDRTTSANARQIRVEERNAGGETASVEIPQLAGMILTDQDKIRGATVASSMAMVFVIYVIEETP